MTDTVVLNASTHRSLVFRWDCTSTLNVELSTEKTLDSTYGITVSKKRLDGKHTTLNVPTRRGY
jgi:hypothetical protein